MIYIIDFGSQTAHLIGRRVRELGSDVKIVHPEEILKPASQRGEQDQNDKSIRIQK